MALTQEEIRIRAGLDYSKVTAGLTDIRSQVYKLASDVPKQLGNILKANVFGAASTLLGELNDQFANILPWKQEFWDEVFGIDKNLLTDLEAATDKTRALRQEMLKAQTELQDAKDKARFGDSTPEEKLRILQQQKLNADIDVTRARDMVGFTEAKLKGRLKPEERGKLVDELAARKTALSEAELKQFNLGRDIREQAGKISPDSQKQMFGQMLSDSVSQVGTIRGAIAKQSALRNAYFRNGDEEGWSKAYSAETVARGQLGQIVQARQIDKLGNVANMLPDVGPFAGIKANLLDAQKAAIEASIQKVAIVEIK